jgi:hypothetical protein
MNKDFAFRKIFYFSLFFLLGISLSHAVIYTTRSGSGNLDDPSSFGAKEIYSGKFRINGTLADMKILASSSPSSELFTRLVGNPEGRKDLSYKKSPGGTVIGFLGEGANARRFLISPVGSTQSCLVFVLKGNPDSSGKSSKASIPWPESLPMLAPTQDPQLVVEHLDTDFIFASVAIQGDSSVDRVLASARQHLVDNGWGVEPMTEKVASDFADSGFAVLAKNSKICWLEAHPGTTPNQVLVTLLCKKP